MALDPGGNYVDEESDYSFCCGYCEYWFNDLDNEGQYIPEIPADLCNECLEDYKDSLLPIEIKGSSLDSTDYDLLGKD